MKVANLVLAAALATTAAPLLAGPASAATSLPALTITAVDAGSFDRVTITSTGDLPVLQVNGDELPPVNPGSGKEQPIAGSSSYVHLTDDSVALSGVTNRATTVGLPNVAGVTAYYFESDLEIHVGLVHAATYQVTSDASHIYLDVAH